MPHLLRIDASSRQEGSHSRALADKAEASWRAAHPDGTVTTRDVTDGAIPILSAATTAGFCTSDDAMTPDLRAATVRSDRLIAEVQAADTLLISAPIYNFASPAALKLWIDQVVRLGRPLPSTMARSPGSSRRAGPFCAWPMGLGATALAVRWPRQIFWRLTCGFCCAF